MIQKKRVFNLYRVSTKKQVEHIKQADSMDDKLDIPMQKQACHAFIDSRPDWEFYGELAELGVSGFKVSAKDRDAIQVIQQAALDKKFDVLLVFMFDRLGRIDDETPFVLEWFVKHGIEVWSVKEGQQRFDQHVDKLTNYIRFWQASGESEKTSMRTKEGLGLIVQQGYFRGGVAPYGYRLEKRGRLDKRGHEKYEIEIDEDEAAVVRTMFDLYVNRGYGSQRIAGCLTEKVVMTRKGENFTNITIYHILRNIAYTGVLRSGETVSEIFPALQIITPEIFDAAQKLAEQRSRQNDAERRVPLNTTGSSLLSGNVFCGHCGARLIVTTNGKKYIKKDGGATVTPRTRYVCYYKTRHKHKCDGQTGYTVSKLDKIVDEVVRGLFARLNDLPKETIIEERYADKIAESRLALTQAKAALQAHTAEVLEYEAEVIKVIRGESKLNSELLNKLYEEAKANAEESGRRVRQLEETLQSSEQMKSELSKQFADIQTWSDMYDTCDMETKKMILSRICGAVRVSRDYKVEIDLTVTCEQLGLTLPESGGGEHGADESVAKQDKAS
ncbi:MAG: recombinase family protein [Peptococcaceae bacterium]|jgi:DNA invertase Pin-like site-specific DNA recombinase|nr:recombinase family protein [Peptococcaceae bacterium]